MWIPITASSGEFLQRLESSRMNVVCKLVLSENIQEKVLATPQKLRIVVDDTG